jgi:hypothetical protein
VYTWPPCRKTLCCLLFAAFQAVAQQATVPLIVEGNAPIVELTFTTSSGERGGASMVVTATVTALL